MESALPVAVVGAGPTGIACAVELARRRIRAVCCERGAILETLYRMPEEMRWFSTRELLAIAGVPFTGPEAHPTRLDTLAYYRGVAEAFQVEIVPDTEVERVVPGDAPGGGVRVMARRGREGGEDASFDAAAAILATGFFPNPRRLGVPGEDLPLVERRYVSGYPFHGRHVVVVGGKNSASEAALDLWRHGAKVTMIVRAAAISDRVKCWIKPDLENRIRAGSIQAHFQSRVVAIEPHGVRIETPAGPERIAADAVFALIGYEPDFALFGRCGIRLEGPERVPAHDLNTLESNVPGIFLAGALLGGTEIGRIFIENSRHHAAMIADAIEKRIAPTAGSPPDPAAFFPELHTSPGNDPDR